jgi:VCBS repeat-containing protein
VTLPAPTADDQPAQQLPVPAASSARALVGLPAFDERPDPRPATSVVPVVAPAAVAGPVARAADPFGGLFSSWEVLFNNQTPRLAPTQTGQSPTGVVSGRLNAVDPDSPRLTFTVTEAPVRGTAAVGADGSWTYTPAAPTAAAGGVDSFRVTVSDAASGFAIHGLAGLLHLFSFGLIGSRGDSSTATVTVTVTAVATGNNLPTGRASVSTVDAVTGRVSGVVTGSDADGDPLSYAVPSLTAKGAVSIDAASGVFTYTPTAVARHGAARVGAPAGDRADLFTVTISDGQGGTAAVPVTVPVSPANVAPVAGTPTVGTPDPVTGVVTGRVSATDADRDPLNYNAAPTTGKGSVAVNAGTGSFSYTPTAAARQNAAAPGATDADRSDRFTVTIADGYGGTAAVPITVAISPSAEPGAPPAAFPGAEGFGAQATGGRGGSVLYVTNLNADGPGSLQWAIDQPGPKYILFKVSGVINSQIHLTNGDVTIAGQTSPGGITVRGFVTDESPYQDQAVRAPADFAENWILQHIRIRPGANGPSDDGLRLRYTRNGIVDHVSIGNATDEAVEISYSNNITVQNTIIAETVGGHSFYGGVLMNYSNPAHGFGLDNIALHHNVFNRIEGRLPEGSRESVAAANSTMNLELSNNLYWDPNFFIALGPDTGAVTGPSGPYPIYWNLNAVNNFFQVRSGFPYGMFDDQVMRTPRNRLFVSGNQMSGYPGRSDYELFYCCNDYPSVSDPNTEGPAAQKLTVRHPFPVITYTPTGQLRTVLLNTAGAWPRDPMDIRLMGNVAGNTIASAPRNTNPAGDALLPAYPGSAPVAPVDTDNDGMPDAWESAKGLNPIVANTNARTLSAAGYTDLEVYLHELSAGRVSGWIAG